MGKQLKDLDDFDNNSVKGDWCFLNNDTYIVIQYGDDKFENIVILPIMESTNKIFWQWNGNKEFPTLSPSILTWKDNRNNPLWHGYFINGELKDC